MNNNFELHHGDCLDVLRTLPDNSIDAVITDPPYGLSNHSQSDIETCLRQWLSGERYEHGKAGFMNKSWDSFPPGPEVWRECLRVLKPGGHMLAFAGTRSMDLMSMAIRLAGFELRDSIGNAHDDGGAPLMAWTFGSGFPKSCDVSKQIDKRGGASVAWFGPWFRKWRKERGISSNRIAELFPSKNGTITGCVRNWELGFNMPTPEQFNLIRDTFKLPFESIEEAEREVVGIKENAMSGWNMDGTTKFIDREITAPATEAAKQWEGWGSALKPSFEPILLCRKPLTGTIAENVLEWGVGALNIDATRIPTDDNLNGGAYSHTDRENAYFKGVDSDAGQFDQPIGRWPANLIHDGSQAVLDLFPSDKQGSAARYFYCAKASRADREEGLDGFNLGNNMRVNAPRESEEDKHATLRANNHPTVKPTALMQYLCRLITPPCGVILDPFTGSGSTGKAAMREGLKFIGIEREEEYLNIARARIEAAQPNNI